MEKEWRCTHCGKLLAVMRGDRLHIRLARRHEYLVGFPVTSVCRNCGTLNEVRGETREAAPSEEITR
jgi:phage FluMu protein Com